MRRFITLLVFGLCAVSFPLTATILELNSPPGSVSFAMDGREAKTASGLADRTRTTIFTSASFTEALALWTSAGRLCEETPGCAHVQIEGEVHHKSTLKRAFVRVYSESWKVIKTDASHLDRDFSMKEMSKVTGMVRATPSR